MIGFWSLSSQSIDGETQNISQYPQDIEFYEDNSYSKQVPNTVSGETDYFGGNWIYDKPTHNLTLISQGDTSLIQTTFDFLVPKKLFVKRLLFFLITFAKPNSRCFECLTLPPLSLDSIWCPKQIPRTGIFNSKIFIF